MKKVLIITYYWFPAGGSGVQRWLKFVKYLRYFNIEPIVYTVKNPQYDFTDESLFKDIPKGITVLKQPIFEPQKLFRNQKESAGFLNEKPSLLEKTKRYIRANYFVPDAKKFWIQPSVKYLKKYLSENKDVDTVITTGPPHSMHLIALQLKKVLPIKWIADFRDPWTDIDYFHKLPLTPKVLKKHHSLEKEVLKNADRVVVVGNTMKSKYKQIIDNVNVITNGYDYEIEDNRYVLDSKYTLTHIGLMNADRNPVILWEAIKELCDEHKDFKNDFQLQLVGNMDNSVKKSVEKYRLDNNVKSIGYVPYTEAQKYQQASQVLLLIVNDVPSAKGIITGKVFEYLQARRPIIAIAPTDGDLADIISKTNSGDVVDFNSKNGLKEILFQYYTYYKQGNLQVVSKNIEKYHRKELTKQLAEIIYLM